MEENKEPLCAEDSEVGLEEIAQELIEVPTEAPQRLPSFLEAWNNDDVSLETLPSDPTSRSYYVRLNLQRTVKMGTTLSLACCELLYETMKNQYWKDWRGNVMTEEGKQERCYQSFQEFASCELGLERRKAYMLAEFYGAYVVDAKVPKEVVAELPYSKAMMAKTVVTPLNWQEVVSKISELTTDSLRAWVNRTKNKTGDDIRLKRFTARLSDSQHDSVSLAMSMALKDINSDDRGAALDFICMDFIAGQLDTPGGKDAVRRLDRHIQAVERNFKVKFGPPSEIDSYMYQDLMETSLDDIEKGLVDDEFSPETCGNFGDEVLTEDESAPTLGEVFDLPETDVWPT